MPFRLRTCAVLGSVLLLGVALGAQTEAPAATDAHAAKVLAEARKAAGTASGLDVKTLEIDFSRRRLAALPMPAGRGNGEPPRQITSDVKLRFLFPGNYRDDEQINLPIGMVSGAITISMALDGGTGWMARTGGPSFFRRPGGAAPPPPTPEELARRQKMMTQRLREDEIRNLLLFTLWPPPGQNLTWKYVGEAHSPKTTADVLDASGPDHFAARFFFDQTTHRLLMVSYKGIIPFSGGGGRGRFGRPGGGPGGPGGPGAAEQRGPGGPGGGERRGPGGQGGPGGPGGGAPGPGGRPQFQRRGGFRMPPPEPIELHFSDFQSEHGVVMPHFIVATTKGKPYEQWKIHSVKWNPGNIRPKDFEKPGK